MTGIVGLATLNRRTILTEMVGVLACLSATLAMSSEVEFELGFHNPLDKTELSWTAQQGATGYQLLRSALTDFSADCETFETHDLFQTDATEPVPGDVLHYLVRELTPEAGGWGTDSGGSPRTVSCMAPTGGLVYSSGCLDLRDIFGAPRRTPDCIEYEYLGGGHLLLKHLNTGFNCCPEFEAGVDVEGDTIIVWEDETAGPCDCFCLFDLHYEIFNLEPAIYDVTVIQEYLYPTDEPLDFTMDLLSSPSGMHCVERNHYPW